MVKDVKSEGESTKEPSLNFFNYSVNIHGMVLENVSIFDNRAVQSTVN